MNERSPPRQKTEETRRFRVTDRFGNAFTIVEFTHYVDGAVLHRGGEQWIARGREYRLANGKAVNANANGSFEEVISGAKYWRA